MEMLIMKVELQDIQAIAEAINDDHMFRQILTRTYTDTWTVDETVFEEYPEIRPFYDDLDDLKGNMMDEFGGYEIQITKAIIADN